MTYQQAGIIEKAIEGALKKAYPGRRVQGLWVNRALMESEKGPGY